MPEDIRKLRDEMHHALIRANEADTDHTESAWLEYEAARLKFNLAIQKEKTRNGYNIHEGAHA